MIVTDASIKSNGLWDSEKQLNHLGGEELLEESDFDFERVNAGRRLGYPVEDALLKASTG